DGVSSQVNEVDNKAQKIFAEIALLKKQIDEDGRLASEINSQAFVDISCRITTVENSLTKKLNDLKLSLEKTVKEQVASATEKLSEDIQALQKDQHEQADIIQKSINHLTLLINTHNIKDAEQFIEVRTLFIEKTSELTLTLKEDMLLLRNEIKENKQKMLEEISGLSGQVNTLSQNLVNNNDITCKNIDTIIDSTASLSKGVKSLEDRAKRIEKVGGQLGRQLNDKMVELAQGVEGAVLSIRIMMQKLEKIEIEQKEQRSTMKEVSTQQVTISQTQVSQGIDLKIMATNQEQEFKDLKTKHENLQKEFLGLKDLINQGNKDLSDKIVKVGNLGGQAVLELKETIAEGFAAQKKKQREKNPQKITDARIKKSEQLGWTDSSNQSGVENDRFNANVLKAIVKNKRENDKY